MKSMRRVTMAAVLCLPLAAAWAGNFRQAYEGALVSDPSYRAARQELVSSTQAVPMARAALLPNVSLSVSTARVKGSRTADNFFGQPVTTPLDYRSPQQTLALRAPLLNLEATQKYRQAQVQLLYAETIFLSRGHDLLDRLGQAYLQRLFAEQSLQVARGQLEVAQAQRQLATRRLELGDGTRPEVSVADAELALARVQLTEAQNQVISAALALAQITGSSTLQVQPFGAAFTLPPLAPATLEQWLDKADAANPAIAVRRLAVEMARLGIARASAGHYPRLDFVASASNGRNDSISTLNQSVSQRSIGLQLNLPLYGGGFVDASVVQAQADQEKAQAELEAEQLSVSADLSRLFLVVSNGLARLHAQRQALDANLLTLQAAEKTLAGGYGILADVVRAQAKVTDAERDLAKARYELLLARMRLFSRAGAAPDEIVQIMDDLLSAATATATR